MGYAAITRDYFPGMGQAVADRTINRKITSSTDGETRVETWGEVAERVALGSALLEHRLPRFGAPRATIAGTELNGAQTGEFMKMHHHLKQASLLMSGRHLQHGDESQASRNIEVFTNCSTAATSFLLFYLLLNGSGVGRAYDDQMMVVDWRLGPTVLCTIDPSHADVVSGEIRGFMQPRDAMHLHQFSDVTTFRVPDSREGWAKAIEMMEQMAFERRATEVLILDFSDVRPRGAPIHGMQKRPASGPGPLMQSIANIARVRDTDMEPWRQAMYVDHYLAECVLVGGARRAARMATKTWRDANIIDFISVKRGGFLWSSNNSVTVDAEFRERVLKVHKRVIPYPREQIGERLDFLKKRGVIDETDAHAYWTLQKLSEAAYFDNTGEPAIINQDRLTQNDVGMGVFDDGHYAESARFKVFDDTIPLMQKLVEIVRKAKHRMITNPCGEITLNMLGGYCVIADVVPFHAQDDDDAEDAFRTATRALIRTNLMDSLYARETKRTNRIGVGITGFHEWAYNRFKFGWKQIVNEKVSLEMWLMLSRFKRAIVQEARRYSRELGVVEPHTNTTFKPAGTTSKLFGLTEGAHLPSMREFVRWVQFRYDDPLVEDYKRRGYPIRELKSYSGTTIVGFPTRPAICELDGGEWVTTAAEATPQEQYEFLRLLEKYWIRGVEEDGVTPLPESGNQVSYTLKYDPAKVSFESFHQTLIEGQFTIRACSVMPQVDATAYEYQPEEPVSKARFQEILAGIRTEGVHEDIGFEHVDCGAGGCPIDFNEGK